MSTAPIIEVSSDDAHVAAALERFQTLFNCLDAGNLKQLPEVYSEDVRFTDPFSSVAGIDDLTHYFEACYANVISCRFVFSEPVINANRVCLPWVMRLRHRRICKGGPVSVDGISHLVIDAGRVVYHRDYFDAGQLLYENLPVIGGFIRRIRSYAG